MKLLKRIILIKLLSLLGLSQLALGDDRFDWMNTDITALGSVFPCIEVPHMMGIHQTHTTLNVENNDVWVPTGVYVTQGKMLAISWNASNILPRPKKYRVLYRIDPRFNSPQLFIQQYDYTQAKYLTDFNSYRTGVLPFYQQTSGLLNSQRITDFNDYFNFVGRSKIQIHRDDVVNIFLDTNGDFFGSDGDLQTGLTGYFDPMTIFTDSSGLMNKILYTSAARWCQDIVTTANMATYTARCTPYPGQYSNNADHIPRLVGRPSETEFTSKILSIPSCPDNVNGPNNIPTCYYDKGRGFSVNAAGVVVKDNAQQFVHSPFTGKYFLYHYATSDGELDFTTSWPLSGMYNSLSYKMSGWQPYASSGNEVINYANLLGYVNSPANASDPVNFFHFGSYAMEIEIGNGTAVLSESDLSSIHVSYFISDTVTPNSSSPGTNASTDFKGNADASGYLWLKVSGAQNESGTINVTTANYTGSTWFSDVVYNDLLVPLRNQYNQLSQIIYEKLISNTTLQNISRSLLVLYIVIYGLAFLAGVVQITITDIVTRVVKISIIVALFSPTSWQFFNDNLFNVFVSGTDYLLNTIVGITSNVGNVFGFIDPIFDRYTNGDLWALLAIQLLQLHNGLAFFSILTVVAILTYFRGLLEVIITYCLAFLGIAVMISLAPFFILLMLFNQTRSMFDNWLSTLFSYMIQPTVLLVFFLLIDQLMAEYITEVVTKACWGILIPLKIAIDLSHIGIPISFTFQLPFLPGIPFYVPTIAQVSTINDLFDLDGTYIKIASSTFIFFIYSKLSSGLIEYVTLVVQYLTNVLAARREGQLQGSPNTVQDIINDIRNVSSPVTSTIEGIGNFAKEKFIDQKITHRSGPGSSQTDYSKIKRTTGTGGGSDSDENSILEELGGGRGRSGAVADETGNSLLGRDRSGAVSDETGNVAGRDRSDAEASKPKEEQVSRERSASVFENLQKDLSKASSEKTPPPQNDQSKAGAQAGPSQAAGAQAEKQESPSEPQSEKSNLGKNNNDSNQLSARKDLSSGNMDKDLDKEKDLEPEEAEIVEEVHEESVPEAELVQDKEEAQTPPKSQEKAPEAEASKAAENNGTREFDTRKAGIGDRHKNMTDAEKAAAAEKILPKKAPKEASRAGDDRARNKVDSESENEDDEK